MNPSLSDDELGAILAARTRFGELRHVAECQSTQELAAAATGPGPGIFWADHQTMGRGRNGRSWDDEPGVDLTFTMRLPQLRIEDPIQLAGSIPVALSEALETTSVKGLKIRWPNDLLLRGRKVCGILIDVLGRPAGTLIGVGINLNRTRFPTGLDDLATSLALSTGRLFDRSAALVEIAAHTDEALSELEAGRYERLQDRFRDRTGLVGQPVRLDAGGQEHRGTVSALDFSGVALADGREFPLGAVQRIRLGEKG